MIVKRITDTKQYCSTRRLFVNFNDLYLFEFTPRQLRPLKIPEDDYKQMFESDDPLNCPVLSYGLTKNETIPLRNTTLNNLVVIESD